MEIHGMQFARNHLTIPSSQEFDDFFMYTYKVRRCSKKGRHDWTDCPFAHRSEKAKRRDPRRFPYHGISCPEFSASGNCRTGQNCKYAHGIFELWLHPTRFRTRFCESGMVCPRKICFFAHTPYELRPEVIQDCFNCNLQGHVIEAPCSSSTALKEVVLSHANKGGIVEEDLADFPHIDIILELLK